MTRIQRAELVFRIGGLAFLFKAIGMVPLLITPICTVIGSSGPTVRSGDVTNCMLSLAGWLPFPTIGLVLLFFSGGFARWFIPAPEIPSRSDCLEIVHLGVIFLGLVTLATAGMMAFPYALMALPYVVVAGVLIAYGDTPAEWLFRQWGGTEHEPSAEPPLLAIGLGFSGASIFLTVGMSLLVLAASPFLWMKGNWSVDLMPFVGWAASFAMGLVLMLFAGGMSKWFGCRPGLPSGWQGSAMRRVKWFEMAFIVGIAWLFVSKTGSVLSSMLGWALDVKDLGLQLLAVLGVVGCVVVPFLAAAWGGARFAAHFYRKQEELPEGETEASVLVFEVAVTIVAIVTLVRVVPSLLFADKADSRLFPVAFSVVLLVLRGDIALRIVARAGAVRRAPAERLGAALRPWLIMVGAWLVLTDLPGLLLAGRLRTLCVSWSWIVEQLVVCAVGAVLVFASKPLSRLFSYGPLLSRRS